MEIMHKTKLNQRNSPPINITQHFYICFQFMFPIFHVISEKIGYVLCCTKHLLALPYPTLGNQIESFFVIYTCHRQTNVQFATGSWCPVSLSTNLVKTFVIPTKIHLIAVIPVRSFHISGWHDMSPKLSTTFSLEGPFKHNTVLRYVIHAGNMDVALIYRLTVLNFFFFL